MARFRGPDGTDVTAALAAAGVHIVHAPGDDAPPALIAEVLPVGERDVRQVVLVEPPGVDDVHTGMGAWHINSVDEVHYVRTGRGLVQFALAEGICSVELLAGDVMIVRKAEHRYLPLEAQEWVIRHSGPPGGGLGVRETGRSAEPWPIPR